MIRAVRIAVEAGFDVEPRTAELIRRHAALILQPSPERVREILLRTLDAPGGASIQLMDSLGLLSALIPELDDARGVEQPKQHYYDVFGHLIAAAEFAGQIVADDYAAPFVAETMPRFDGMDAYFSQRFSDGHTRGAFLNSQRCSTTWASLAPGRSSRPAGCASLDTPRKARKRRRTSWSVCAFAGRGSRLVRAMILHHLRPRQMAKPANCRPTARYTATTATWETLP